MAEKRLLAFGASAAAEEQAQPLILQEMSWVDVRDYLKADDMVNDTVKFINARKRIKSN